MTDLAAEPAYRLLGGSDLAQPPPPPRGTGFPSAAATADGVPEPAATTTPPPSASTSTSTGDAAKDASTASTTTAAGTGSGAAASSGGISGGSGSSGSSGSGKVAADGVHGGLPHIERIRLALQNPANGGLRSERHREVVQYYQYSADRGNTEAQTAVGQVRSAGCGDRGRWRVGSRAGNAREAGVEERQRTICGWDVTGAVAGLLLLGYIDTRHDPRTRVLPDVVCAHAYRWL